MTNAQLANPLARRTLRLLWVDELRAEIENDWWRNPKTENFWQAEWIFLSILRFFPCLILFEFCLPPTHFWQPNYFSLAFLSQTTRATMEKFQCLCRHFIGGNCLPKSFQCQRYFSCLFRLSKSFIVCQKEKFLAWTEPEK